MYNYYSGEDTNSQQQDEEIASGLFIYYFILIQYYNLLFLRQNKKLFLGCYKGSVCISYFNHLFQYHSVHLFQFPANDTAIGDMDYAITMDELDKASTILKVGKTPGYDNVLNEMIRCLMEKYPKLIIKLFNRILQSNCIIPDWLISLIVPIHKKGSKTNPTNYRGFSLLSCLGKRFLTILHNRLWKFANEKNILTTSQLGFVKGSRTSDEYVILNNLIDEYCQKTKNTYIV